MSAPKKAILTIALTKHLTGNSIDSAISSDWAAKSTPAQREAFDNVGFDFDPTNEAAQLAELEKVLRGRNWDGVMLGWCVRGHVEFTVLFERLVSVVVGEVVRRAQIREDEGEGMVKGDREGERLKVLFSEGPADLWRTAMRGFGSA
jgi:hypothetical protein